MAIRVKTPNASWEGEVAGVKFFHGEAIFEDEVLGKRVAESLGYEVLELSENVVQIPKHDVEPKKPTRAKKESK